MIRVPTFDVLRRRGRSTLRLAEALARNPISRINRQAVIVLGNQKSGTTAVAALLAHLSGSTVTLDLTREILYPTHDRVKDGRMSFETFVRRNRFQFSRTIIKDAHLAPFYKELRSIFPQARFVLVVRDPRDNIRSILDRLEISGRDPEASLASPHRRDRRAWRLVLDGSWLGIQGSGTLEHLAHRWNVCADVYVDHPDLVRLIRYEDFVADRRRAITDLASSLGLNVTRAELAEDVARRSYQPPGKHRAQTPLEFFGSENLATIEAICGTRMAKLGYEPIGLARHSES